VSSHLIEGTLALLTGPIQFFKWMRNKNINFHKLTENIYIIGAIITGLSAVRLSLISSCVTCRVSLFILAVLVPFTTFSAWWCVKNRNIKAHQQFMPRSYLCIFSFVAVRIGGIIPLDFLFGQIEDPTFSRTVNKYFFSFAPIICGEIYIIWIPTLKILKKAALLPVANSSNN
jgi:uncharacterized membrane protein